jgi:hypothetical protein
MSREAPSVSNIWTVGMGGSRLWAHGLRAVELTGAQVYEYKGAGCTP